MTEDRNELIFGRTWQEIQDMQRRDARARDLIDLSKPGDYGADPLGNGRFRMVPSGDIADLEERNRRLKK